MRFEIALFQAGVSLLSISLISAPFVFDFVSGGKSRDVFSTFLCACMTSETSKWFVFPSLLANYAFLSGLLMVVTGRTDTSPPTLPYNGSDLVAATRHIVAIAFDQGLAANFSWPPPQGLCETANEHSCDTIHHVAVAVQPMATVMFGIPVLIFLAIAGGVPPFLGLVGSVANVSPWAWIAFVDGLTTWTQSVTFISVRSFDLLNFSIKTVVARTVDTFLPMLMGSGLVVLTALGLVMYSVGHVGLTVLQPPAMLELDQMSADRIAQLITSHLRAFRQIDWAWWWESLVEWDRKHRHGGDGEEELFEESQDVQNKNPKAAKRKHRLHWHICRHKSSKSRQ